MNNSLKENYLCITIPPGFITEKTFGNTQTQWIIFALHPLYNYCMRQDGKLIEGRQYQECSQ